MGKMDVRQRRIWSKVTLGLLIPGDYYFLTLTSSPSSPDIAKSWDIGKKRMFRKGYEFDYYGVRTNEGFGVIHVILRSGKRINISWLRLQWIELHNANQIWIKEIKNFKGIPKYLQSQGDYRIAGEFCYQHGILKQLQSKWWIYPGWNKIFKQRWKNRYREVDLDGNYVPIDQVLKYWCEWVDWCRTNRKAS